MQSSLKKKTYKCSKTNKVWRQMKLFTHTPMFAISGYNILLLVIMLLQLFEQFRIRLD